MRKQILITGASGFFGQNLINYLPVKNYSYLLILRKKIKNLDKKNFTQIIVKDVFRKKVLFWSQYLTNVDTVIHLAWTIKKDFYQSKNNKICYLGTIELAKACKVKNIKRFIGIGSCAEYLWNNKIITTKSKLRSNSNYSKYKILTYKNLIKLFSKKTKFVWLRPFFVFGKYQKNHQFYPSILDKYLKKKKIIIFNSKNQYDFVPIDFLCKFIIKIIKKKNIRKNSYNICTGKPKSLKKFISNIFKDNLDLFDFRQTKKKLKVFGRKEKV